MTSPSIGRLRRVVKTFPSEPTNLPKEIELTNGRMVNRLAYQVLQYLERSNNRLFLRISSGHLRNGRSPIWPAVLSPDGFRIYPIILNTARDAIVEQEGEYALVKPQHSDQSFAMLERGGIDLNAKNMTMEAEGPRMDIHFNKAMITQFENGNYSGIQFNVLDVVPINMRVILGL